MARSRGLGRKPTKGDADAAVAPPDTGRADVGRPPDGPGDRPAKFVRRVSALPPGRYVIILTVDTAGARDWSVQPAGKVEP